MAALSLDRKQPYAKVLSLANGGCGLHFTTLVWPLSCPSSIQVYVALESPPGLHWIDRWWAPNPLLLLSEICCCAEPRRFDYWRMLAIWETILVVADLLPLALEDKKLVGQTKKKVVAKREHGDGGLLETWYRNWVPDPSLCLRLSASLFWYWAIAPCSYTKFTLEVKLRQCKSCVQAPSQGSETFSVELQTGKEPGCRGQLSSTPWRGQTVHQRLTC